jgi:hypothetical protein
MTNLTRLDQIVIFVGDILCTTLKVVGHKMSLLFEIIRHLLQRLNLVLALRNVIFQQLVFLE